MPVVRLADGLVEWLVLDVKEATPMQGSRGDHCCVSASDELAKKVVRLLAVLDAGEGTVLPLEEDAGMHQDVDQKPRLPLGKPKLRDRVIRSSRTLSLRSRMSTAVIERTPPPLGDRLTRLEFYFAGTRSFSTVFGGRLSKVGFEMICPLPESR